MGKKQEESYYKILGTTAKIGQGRVKEKYIEAVKQHPPETDPEGFEKVRRAYETLNDPEKRKQYDLYRKYGENVDDLAEKALVAMDEGDIKKAEDMLQKASTISPNSIPVNVSLMKLAVLKGDLERLEDLFDQTIKGFSAPEEIAILYSLKARVLAENDHGEEAIETLEEGIKQIPEHASLFGGPLSAIYMEMGRGEEALETIESVIPSPENETIDDIHLFISWVNIICSMEKWNTVSKVKTRFLKFLKGLTNNEEDAEEAYNILMGVYDGLYESAQFREAELFLDFVKVLADKQDQKIRELQNKTKKLARLQKEISRLQQDEAAFPLLFLDAFDWFYKDYIPLGELIMMKNSIPFEIEEELRQEKEDYAAGIIRLRKKYPLLYKEYKEKWDQLYEELTEGFNREMKRQLRRMK